jgi:hypothetical protein
MKILLNKIFRVTVSVVLAVAFMMSSVYSQEEEPGIKTEGFDKLAQTGFKFLTISTDARAASMGDAMTAMDISSTAMLYNPASMSGLNSRFSVGLNHTQWIADVTYNSATFAINTPIGVFGLSGVMVEYGEFLETIRSDANPDGFIDLGTYTPTANAFGVGYARSLTNRFSVGGHIKYATQDLTSATVSLDDTDSPVKKDYNQSTVAVDFGVIYDTGFNGLQIAMTARNFSGELTYVEENFELPLQFRIGVAMDLVNLTQINSNVHSLMLAIDTERPRDYFEQLKVGMEYTFLNTFALRAGYIAPHDEQGINVGFGIKSLAGFDVDYSYTDFGIFDGVSRFAVKFAF